MKKQTKKWCSIFLCVIMFISTVLGGYVVADINIVEVYAADVNPDVVTTATTDIIASGTSISVVWSIDANGQLLLSGTGNAEKTYTVSGKNYYPWYEYKDAIKSAKITVTAMTDASYLFQNCSKLTSVDTTAWDTGKITDMSFMFYYCSSLESIDVSKWDVSNVENMKYMFYSCGKLKSLDVSKWNTGNVMNLNNTFGTCLNLTTLDVSKWNTSKVTDMGNLFNRCQQLLTLEVGNWDTGNVQTMNSLFAYCQSLTNLDLSKWDTSSVTNMDRMFKFCNKLETVNVGNFDTAMVKDMGEMFYNCNQLTNIDVSKWNIAMVEAMDGMFNTCYKLKSLDLGGWKGYKLENITEIFNGCSNLSCEFTVYNDINQVEGCLSNAATTEGSCISLNYVDEAFRTTIDNMMATKTEGSNIVMEKVTILEEPDTVVNLSQNIYQPTGNEICPIVTVTHNGVALQQGVHYKLVYTDNIEAGEAKVSVVGIGDYVGTVTKSYYIIGDRSWKLKATANEDGTVTVKVYGTFCQTRMDGGLMYDPSQVVPIDVKWYYRLVSPGPALKGKNIFTEYSVTDKRNYNFLSLQAKSELPVYWDAEYYIMGLEMLEATFFVKKNVTTTEFAFSKNTKEDMEKLKNGQGNVLEDVATVLASCSVNPVSMPMVTYEYEGISGGVHWGITERGHLVLEGDGNLASNEIDDIPWLAKADMIKTAEIKTTNMTNASNLFYDCAYLKWVGANDWDVSKIADMSGLFSGCSALESLDNATWNTRALTNIDEIFKGCAMIECQLTLANDITSATNAFANAATGEDSLIVMDYTGAYTRKTAINLVKNAPEESNVVLKGVNLLNGSQVGVALEKDVFPYTGKEIKPKATVTYKETQLEENVDYELLYGNNIEIGIATVTVAGINAYDFEKSTTFEIEPTPTPMPTPTSTSTSVPTYTPSPSQSASPRPSQSETPVPEASKSPVPESSESMEPGPSEITSPTPVPEASKSPVPESSESTSPVPSESTSPAPGPSESASPAPSETTEPNPDITPPPSSTVMLGDVDGNKSITLADAQLVLKVALKIITLEEPYITAGDVDGNGTITLADAQQVLKYALKIISEFTPAKQ